MRECFSFFSKKIFSFCSFNFWRIFRCDFLVEYKYFNLFVLACILQVIFFANGALDIMIKNLSSGSEQFGGVVSGLPRLGLFWQSFGPYHLARLQSLKDAAKGRFELVAVEVSETSSTYAWRRDASTSDEVQALYPGKVAEQVGLWASYLAMKRWLKQQLVDVLFVPSYWPGYALGAVLAARSMGVSVVIMTDSHHSSGANNELSLAVKTQLLRLADAAFVAGSNHRAFMRSLGLPADRIFDGYDIVDNAYFIRESDAARAKADEWRAKLALPRKYLLSLGRLVAKKNLETVIQAYARLVAAGAHGGHALVIVGSGSERERLIALARHYSLPVRLSPDERLASEQGGEVLLYPFAQVETTPVFYALATAFILASRTDEWGLVVNEAMASGLPVVVSRSVGAAPDLVRPGENGYRFYADNPEELALCLERLCKREEIAAQFGVQARIDIAAWGPDRFTRGALGAAEAAMRPWSGRLNNIRDDEPLRDVRLLQTCLPDYRVAVFAEAASRMPGEFRLYSGPDYFTPDVRVTEDCHDWRSPIYNRFMLGRRLLWQPKALSTMLVSDVAIMELNPRIISSWAILALRAAFGAPTILWGHAWARQGANSHMNIIRILMMRMATAVVTYTTTQRKLLSPMLNGKPIFSAPNSLVSVKDCDPVHVKFEELKRVIYVGRLNTSKKVSLLIEGFARTLNRLPSQVELCVVGDGLERNSLMSQAEQLGLANRVRFLGHISSHEILRDLYAEAFCSVSPGYVGLSCIQSFSFGVPLLVADKEPHAPEIEACAIGRNTVFFSAGEVDDLAEKLVSLWQERANWLRRRAEISRDIAENYSLERMVTGLVSAIDAVCSPSPVKQSVASPASGAHFSSPS